MARSLVAVDVEGLLHRFNHSVQFPADSEFVIIHGPNGVGKTKLLELIAATFEPSIRRIAAIPFDAARFSFDDGSILSLTVTQNKQSPSEDSRLKSRATVRFLVNSSVSDPIEWQVDHESYEHLSQLLRYLERELPVQRMGPDIWYDYEREVHTDSDDLIRFYADRIERLAPPVLARKFPSNRVPEDLQAYLDSVDVHLIETQRLLKPASAPRRLHRRHFESEPRRATVAEFSEDLVANIKSALAWNSKISQDLDRSFPERLLSRSTQGLTISDEEIRDRYQEQNVLRARLSTISALDTAQDVPLPDRELKEWERVVLWRYLEDTEHKLNSFRDLLEKVEVLKEIVDSRFLYKKLNIDGDHGFRFVTDSGNEVEPDQLSSGEQHELVLVYDLLFNVKKGGLVLIDEPEISLHVSWQQEFLNDVLRIARIASLRFIVATHSPQIVHKWWSRMVPLLQDGTTDEGVPHA